MQRMRLAILGFLFLIIAFPVYADHAININTADLKTLDLLPGIGEKTAQLIIDYRHGPDGPFETIEEISAIKGIGEPGSKSYEDIKGHITVSGGVAATQNDPPPDVQESQQTNQGVSSTASSQSENGEGNFVEPKISAYAGIDRTVFVGADSIFEARAIGLTGEPIENARFVWTFGNGGRKEGKSVLYNFAYPGVYAVILDVSSGPYSASDRAIIDAIPALISLNEVTDAYVSIENKSDVELDLGGWILATDTARFTFPSHTIVLPHEEVRFAHAATGLTPENAYALSLLYPNGVFAASYQSPLIVGRRSTASPGSATARPQASVPPPTSVPTPPGTVNAKTDESQNLIAAPLAALDPTATTETNFSPPFFGWMMALVAVIGVAIGGVFFVRKGTRSGYAIQEVKDT